MRPGRRPGSPRAGRVSSLSGPRIRLDRNRTCPADSHSQRMGGGRGEGKLAARPAGDSACGPRRRGAGFGPVEGARWCCSRCNLSSPARLRFPDSRDAGRESLESQHETRKRHPDSRRQHGSDQPRPRPLRQSLVAPPYGLRGLQSHPVRLHRLLSGRDHLPEARHRAVGRGGLLHAAFPLSPARTRSRSVRPKHREPRRSRGRSAAVPPAQSPSP